MRYLNIVPLRLALAVLVLATALFAYSADSAQASSLFRGEMDGAQEVPATPSAGTGTAIVVLNDAEDTAFVSVVLQPAGHADRRPRPRPSGTRRGRSCRLSPAPWLVQRPPLGAHTHRRD